MRAVGKNWAAIKRCLEPERQEFKEKFPLCMICRSMTSDVHEINSGALRKQAYVHPYCWLSVCRECHGEIHDTVHFPVSKQLAVKLISDPDNFDLDKINKMRRGCKPMVSFEEVVAHLCLC